MLDADPSLVANRDAKPRSIAVSIIIPGFNGTRYMPRLVSSLRATLDSSIEVIFVNDGSTDGSLEKFQRGIPEAVRTPLVRGTDPNDLGDVAWNDDPLKLALERHYLPHVNSELVVLELGPGTGRLTRHLIGRCKRIILVDYSSFVCEWLERYLRGKGYFEVHQIAKPAIGMVAESSVDVVLANGVFEHIDVDNLYAFMEDFRRLLKPGGVVAFNFDNICSAGGLEHFKAYSPPSGGRRRFRFYHPETLRILCESLGFQVISITTDASRFGFIEMKKGRRFDDLQRVCFKNPSQRQSAPAIDVGSS